MEGVLKEIEGSLLDHDLVQQRLRLLAKSINWTNTGTDINWRNYNRVKKLLFNDEVSGGVGSIILCIHDYMYISVVLVTVTRTNTKLIAKSYLVNLYLHEFFELILFFNPTDYSPWFKREVDHF